MTQVTEPKIEEFSRELLEAQRTRSGISPLTDRVDLSVREAYEIQLHGVEQRCANGARVTGKKIGLTSRAMQNLIGVDQPDYGHLLDTMAYTDGATIPTDRLLLPRMEAEIAFVFDRTLEGPGITTLDIAEATRAVYPALEVVDSRVQDWDIEFEDSVADNASSGVYVLGSEGISGDRLQEIDIRELGMVLRKDGRVVQTGAGAATLGNPIYCLAWLANTLARFDISLDAGEVVLSGALSSAIDVEPGDEYEASFSQLGTVQCQFE